MPQAPTRKESSNQRAQDKESKRARGALSCAECRRLKLKCDKVVPCSSCKRRGCSEICPNGSLRTGQGTRFVLADTEALHQKIAVMSDRIRQLEDALAILQSTVSGSEPHPLLSRDLLKIKSSLELHAASRGNESDDSPPREQEEEPDLEQSIDSFGTLAIRDDGAATFYGRSAGQESLLIGEASTTPPASDVEPSPHFSAGSSYVDYHRQSQLQRAETYSRQSREDRVQPTSAISALADMFPLAPSISSAMSGASVLSPLSAATTSMANALDRISLQDLVNNYLPPPAEAHRLVQLYLEQAPWFFGAVTRRQVEEEIMPLWYGDNSSPSIHTPAGAMVRHTSSIGSPGTSSSKTDRSKSSHDLALLFIIFCFGALTDTNLAAPPDNAPAEKYYQLTKAALSLDPGSPRDGKMSRNGLFERPPSVASVQTLSLMAIFEGMCSGENSIESTWALMGLSCKLAQSVGLHRDCARWKLTPAEVQKRRGLFWELFITDCWQSLATGRIATFSLPFVDCELPADPDQTIAPDGSIQPSFPYWKAKFGAECVSAVVQGTLTSRAPKYSIIIELDRKVRDIALPQYSQGPPPTGVGLAQTMSHFMPQNYRELTLLYVHRIFFLHALTSHPKDPLKSQYAPSFLAGYRSACTILALVRKQFELFPAQIARFWVLWTHAFSGAVMLSSVPTRSPEAKIAPAAMLEFKNACDLFEAASAYGGRAVKFLPILRRLQIKAQKAFRDLNNGVAPNARKDIFKPSQPDDGKDEFSIFGGKTHTITTKSTPPVTASSTPANPGMSVDNSATSSPSGESPQQILTDNPSFANVHPSLMSELNSFQGQIRAQIHTAYRSGEELFLGAPMAVDNVGPSPAGSSNVPPQLYYSPQGNMGTPHDIRAAPEQNQYAMYQQQQQQAHQQQQIKRRQSSQHELNRQRAEAEMIERQKQQAALQQQQQQQQQQQHARPQEMQPQMYHQQRQEAPHPQHPQQRVMPHSTPAQQQNLTQQPQQQYRQDYHQVQSPEQYQAAYISGAPEHAYASGEHAPPPQSAGRPYMQPQQPPPQPRQQEPGYQYQTPHPSVQVTVLPHNNPQPQSYQHPVPRQQQSTHQHHPTHQQPAVYQRPPEHQHEAGQHYQQTQQYPGAAEAPMYHQQVSQEPQPMYQVTPEYPLQHQHQQQPVPNAGRRASYVQQPPSAAYVEQQQAPPASAGEYQTAPPAEYKYWPAAPQQSFAMPNQPAAGMQYGVGPSQQHYTPDGALQGIAADDRSLQETWQSYMTKVGSPRQFLED